MHLDGNLDSGLSIRRRVCAPWWVARSAGSAQCGHDDIGDFVAVSGWFPTKNSVNYLLVSQIR